MRDFFLSFGFGLLVIRTVYWVYAVWERGNPGWRVFSGQLGELSLLFLFLTQTVGFQVLPMSFSLETSLVGFLLVFLGVGMSFLAKMQLGKNWSYAGEKSIATKLITTGIYKYVRHPLYTGYVLSFVGMEVLISSWLWISFIAMFIPFYFQVKKEEMELEKKFGKRYKEYKEKTKLFVPGVF